MRAQFNYSNIWIVARCCYVLLFFFVHLSVVEISKAKLVWDCVSCIGFVFVVVLFLHSSLWGFGYHVEYLKFCFYSFVRVCLCHTIPTQPNDEFNNLFINYKNAGTKFFRTYHLSMMNAIVYWCMDVVVYINVYYLSYFVSYCVFYLFCRSVVTMRLQYSFIKRLIIIIIIIPQSMFIALTFVQIM